MNEHIPEVLSFLEQLEKQQEPLVEDFVKILDEVL
jgi:hypothetical protein